MSGPCLFALRYSRVAKEAYCDRTNLVGREVLRGLAGVLEHFLLIVAATLRIGPNKIVGDDAFEILSLSCGNRLCPLTCAIENVLLCIDTALN